jgi:hypothetical protein
MYDSAYRHGARATSISAFTAEESADDVEALRLGLGAPQITLLAGSYGSHLALAVMHDADGEDAAGGVARRSRGCKEVDGPVRLTEMAGSCYVRDGKVGLAANTRRFLPP